MHIKRVAALFGIVLVMICIFTACANEDMEEEPEPVESHLSIERMVEEMLEVMEDPDVMELAGEHIQDFYGIDVQDLEGYAVRAPLLHEETNEIALFKVKEEGKITSVKESVEQRAADVQAQFEDKDPAQYAHAKNFIVNEKGHYILFVISKHANEVVDTYEQFFE